MASCNSMNGEVLKIMFATTIRFHERKCLQSNVALDARSYVIRPKSLTERGTF